MEKPTERILLAGSARVRPTEAKLVSTVPEAEFVPITLLLRYPPGRPPILTHDDWDKVAHHQRKFLSTKEFASTYGATKEDVAAVLAFVKTNNMTLFRADAATRSISVNCSAASAKSAFGIQLNRYESSDPMVKGDSTYTHYGFDGEVHLPSKMAEIITGVVGLDDRKIYSIPDSTGDPPATGTGLTATPLLVSQIAQLYQFPKLPASTPASDVVIGIHAPSGSYLQTDINTYFQSMPTGWQTVPVVRDVNCVVGGTTFTNGLTPMTAAASQEVSQDIQTSTTIAQGCTANVYFTQNSEQGWVSLMKRVQSPLPGEKVPLVITTSFPLDRGETFVGDPKSPASQSGIMTGMFSELAMSGINVFASAGDFGSEDSLTDKKAHVQYPASDPWVTAIGGTVIGNVNATIDSSGNFNNGTFDEYVWSDVNTTSPFTSTQPFGATGGGVSALFDRPSYQSALIVKDSTGKTLSGRAIPDIAGMVGGSGYVINSSTVGFIGTSVTTPMYAGLFAVYRSAFGQNFGPLNSYLYTIGTTFPKAYKDVTTGDNDSGDATPYFTAGAGWDAASGWGSINGQSMEDALAHLLYPKNFYVTVRKNSFGLDELSGDIASSGAGSKDYPAFWLALEGYSPNQLPAEPPTVTSALFSAASVSLTVGAPIIEIQSLRDTPQRILYPCTVTFFNAAAHPTNDPVTPGVFPAAGSDTIARTVVAFINLDGGQEADSEIELTPGANPYFSNVVENPSDTGVNYWFLSNDLRVFTTTPGALSASQRPLNDTNSPAFPTGSGTARSAQSGYTYIQSLLTYLNTSYNNTRGPDPFTLLPGQNNALSTYSSVSPSSNGQINYSFAIARVRISGPSNSPVKVYFRIFAANTPDADFDPDTTYLTTNGSPSIGVGVTTIPMFATGNYQTNSDFKVNNDYGQPSANNFAIVGPGDHWAYFGCYLNLYPLQNTIPVNGKNVSVSSQLPGTHHCLVAQIDFPDAPIKTINGMSASPENSDKLAQRNINISKSDNPGPEETHRIPQTFDIRPSIQAPTSNPLFYLPDELMIDWGNTPPGSTASIYWPRANILDVVAQSKKLYATRQLSVSLTEANTLQCTVPAGGYTYVPIPVGSGDNFAGLFTIQLPQGVVRGQEFLLTVDRISSRTPTIKPKLLHATRASKAVRSTNNWRYITGTFAVRIPVSVPSEILPSELDAQSILAWRLNQMSPTDRWYPVLQRYLSYINDRVTGLGYTGPVVPSPNGASGTIVVPPVCPPKSSGHCGCEDFWKDKHCCCERLFNGKHARCTVFFVSAVACGLALALVPAYWFRR